MVLCILGMHRSGTSCLAGSLEEAGLHFGVVNTVSKYNKKGNRENQRVIDLHDAVLRRNGGSWYAPPEKINWSAEDRAERDAIIRSYGDTPRWGFKDPRTVFLTDFWSEAIPNLTFVGTLRHPYLVAESLTRRGGGSMNDWLDLWMNYNSRILALHNATPFPILRFDLGEDSYRRSLAVVMSKLGLDVSARKEFFDPILRHHEASEPVALPEPVHRLYRSLCRISLDP